MLRRVRAMRGIAGVKDHPSLADVLEATEFAAHPLERGEAQISAERLAVLGAAATVLRGISAAMRIGASLDPASPELARFAAALDAMQEKETEQERVVPISELFYEDGGPTVVQPAPNPPTSPAERFRLEVVSQGEHLRRLVADARDARDALARDSVRRALRQALRGLRQAAESYGERDVAAFVASHNDDVVQLDSRALDSLDEIATMLAQPATSPASLVTRLRALQRRSRSGGGPRPRAPAPAQPAPAQPAPAQPAPAQPAPAQPAPYMTPVRPSTVAPPSATPQERDRPAAAAMAQLATRGAPAPKAELGSLLDAGIAKLGALEHRAARRARAAAGAARRADRRAALSRPRRHRALPRDPRSGAERRRSRRRGDARRAVRPARPRAHGLSVALMKIGWRGVVGILLSAGFLYFAFRGIRFDEVATHMRSTNVWLHGRSPRSSPPACSRCARSAGARSSIRSRRTFRTGSCGARRRSG